uniref:Uncharacterized protein n=1 Tax=viral metagenome TaxID=1070528 RepID=A0A6M3LLQ5_9ZZZZ
MPWNVILKNTQCHYGYTKPEKERILYCQHPENAMRRRCSEKYCPIIVDKNAKVRLTCAFLEQECVGCMEDCSAAG